MGCVVRRFPFIDYNPMQGEPGTEYQQLGDDCLLMQLGGEIEENSGDRSRTSRRLVRSSWLVLLFLLLLNSFVQAHLWKYRPFRATDTDHSGGDHICDLRRNCDEDGRPDRLGDCVSVSGTVIAEPSTFEIGGWIFWIRDGQCGIMVYGEQEALAIGDSVMVTGWLRITNGGYFFPGTGLATLGDLAIENGGTAIMGGGQDHLPLDISAADFCAAPGEYGGNLVRLEGLSAASYCYGETGDLFMRLADGDDSLVVYIDGDTGCMVDPGADSCFTLTGIVTRINTPDGISASPAWCVGPRRPCDIVQVDCSSDPRELSWGKLKADHSHQD
jgi:hypothetical protein